MARRVFFSFHYERDIWRASIVRNSWLLKGDSEEAGFWDASLWEEAKRKGDDAIKRMIGRGLQNTSVTVVLIGAETAALRWVLYEIEQSHYRKNGLVGVWIHSIKDRFGRPDSMGGNPFDCFNLNQNGRQVPLSTVYPVFDWVQHDGYNSLGDWVEDAARRAGRT